ncbi:hypothetical protein Goari_009711 [Gossypium aridum]|uniref:Knottin scorpion toxin-like domain-containing protein n=1 Tax=Gossypium aridum TaxID=34290 RepID=A0A7J8XZ96_GOSAI|nr:hypothetical protein [Gossypium aridum]
MKRDGLTSKSLPSFPFGWVSFVFNARQVHPLSSFHRRKNKTIFKRFRKRPHLENLKVFFGTTGTQMVEAQVCSRPSQTTGVVTCPSNLLCDRRCRDIEGAMYGACQPRLLGSTCLCYVRC